MRGKVDYLRHWRALRRPAWLYLAHAALLTGSLAVTSLLFNLAVLALGFPRAFLGTLAIVGVASAAALSLPLWWLAARNLRGALLMSAALQAGGALAPALWPARTPLLLAAAATGAAAVLFQVSAAPYMMRHSDGATRDHLFSANAAVNVGVAGLGSLLAGRLPALCAALLGVAPESAPAYRAAFAVAAGGMLLACVPLLLSVNRKAQSAEQDANGAPPPSTDLPPPQPTTRPSDSTAADDATFSVQRSAFSVPKIVRRFPRSAFRFPLLVPLLIPPALISVGAALLVPYLNLFFKERFALPDDALGAIFAALGVATGAAALAGPLVSAQIGKARTIALTQALSIPFLLAVGFAPLLWMSAGAAVARGALFNMGAPLYDALAMERSAPAARPMVIGLINAAYAGGYLVAPALSVAVQERYGFAPLFVATSACYALAVLATCWFFGRAHG